MRAFRRATRFGGLARRWVRLLRRPTPDAGLRVSYGLANVPADGARAAGGTAKLQKLATRFPSTPDDFTLLYLGSSGLPHDLRVLLRLARRRGAPVVLNQDGVGYPAWAGDRANAINRPLRAALSAADYVLYQSAFCKEQADRVLGAPRGRWAILHNAVDCDRFEPPASPPVGPPVVLVAGNQTSPGRLGLALATFAVLRESEPDATLLLAGDLPRGKALPAAGVAGIEVIGSYTQREAPDLYGRAHVLLHPKVLDPCPNVVLEALACGVPVVYPASGGTPELVGDAGIGVPHEISFDRLSQPTPAELAAAIGVALTDRSRLSPLARKRAEEQFPLDRWLDRHAELFAELVPRRAER